MRKVAFNPDSRPETRRCDYCYIKGHLKSDCRKRLAAEKRSAEGQREGPSTRKMSANEVEAEMAGFDAWDEPREITR